MLVVKSGEEALQVEGALLGSDEGTQILFDAVIGQLVGMFVRWSESLRRTIDALVGQHRFQCSPQATGGGHGEERLEGLGRPVVVGIAIGEREAANALRIERGENLRDAAAAVIADEIDVIDVQGIEKLLEHL